MLLPRSRIEVKVAEVPPFLHNKANAGGAVEGQQASDDDVFFRSACRNTKTSVGKQTQ